MIEEKAKRQKHHHFPKIPWYGWVGAIIFLGLHLGLYKLGCYLSENVTAKYGHWEFCPKINAIDGHIPYTPYFFVEIYFLSYIFWFIVPLIVSTGKKENFINFMIYSIIAYVAGFIWLTLMPTYIDRTGEHLQEKIDDIKTPVTKFLANLILKMDGGNMAWNLCPSYHCLSSALCAYALIRETKHHVATRVCTYVMAFLIVCSTVLVKQHYFADVLGGVGVATIAFLCIKLTKVGERIMINNPLFLQTKHLTKRDVVKAEDANEATKEERKEKIKKK